MFTRVAFLRFEGPLSLLFNAPGVRLRVAIHETRDGLPILDATLAGERRALTDGAMLRQVLGMLDDVKVIAGITGKP